MSYKRSSRGFILPSVVIASVVMLAVLVTAVGVTVSVRSTLNEQYYNELASDAAESGSVYATYCAESGALVLNTPITPATDCTGATVGGASLYIISTTNLRTTYTATLVSSGASGQVVEITGTTERLRTSNGNVYETKTQTLRQVTVYNSDAQSYTTQRY